MINPNFTYAVVGASSNPEKYGHKVLKDLLKAGYKAIAINPKGGQILEQPVYPTLADYPDEIDVVVFVVPPKVTQKVLDQVVQLGIKQVWMQPGSESQAAIDFCQQHQIKVQSQACIMLERTPPKEDQAQS